jgi:hypothetical protein
MRPLLVAYCPYVYELFVGVGVVFALPGRHEEIHREPYEKIEPSIKIVVVVVII